MDRTTKRQPHRSIQLSLPLHLPVRRRMVADNQDDPFASAPYPTRRVFTGERPNVVRLGLTLADAIARDGPGYD